VDASVARTPVCEDRLIHHFTALHATLGGKLELAGIIQEIDVPFFDHETSTPAASSVDHGNQLQLGALR
jgi:hypothetical protein